MCGSMEMRCSWSWLTWSFLVALWKSLSTTSASIRKFYKQLQGAAMGWPVSPVIANIYVEYFESLAIPSSPTLIKWWFRYVDDVHSATRKDQVNKHQEYLNSIDPHIKFTTELPGIDGLHFLDTLTKPTPNSNESTVHRKPTHTDRYLDYNSNHPISAKLSVIHTLIHRAKQVCSTPEFLAKEMDHLHKVLQENHYPTQFFQQSNPQQCSSNGLIIKMAMASHLLLSQGCLLTWTGMTWCQEWDSGPIRFINLPGLIRNYFPAVDNWVWCTFICFSEETFLP